jgi:hypothetical protein
MGFADTFGSKDPVNGTLVEFEVLYGLFISEIIDDLSDQKPSTSEILIATSLP